MKIVICINTSWNILNFRQGLIAALLEQGHEVIALAPKDAYSPRLIELGCRFVDMPMPNGGTNPVEDLGLLMRFKRFFRDERPDVFLGYTAKPNIYGSIAARSFGIPVINNIAGLGAVFISKSLVTMVVKVLYRLALSSSACVFFQNKSDRELFIEHGIIRHGRIDLVPGSGINLTSFQPRTTLITNDVRPFRFLLIGRMLKDKGVVEFVEAARTLRARHQAVEFALLGAADYDNPAAISHREVDAWVREGCVTYLGTRDDVRAEIDAADCIVLPSYREGTPRTLLEAAAMAKPIVTTNAVGCREVVTHGLNGFLCEVANASDLASKMENMLNLSEVERREMGLAGRRKMEAEFDEQLVVSKYLETIRLASRR